jgi:hypothetical protein
MCPGNPNRRSCAGQGWRLHSAGQLRFPVPCVVCPEFWQATGQAPRPVRPLIRVLRSGDMRRLRSSRYRMRTRLVGTIRILAVQRYDGIQRIMHRNVHHDMSAANARIRHI